MLNSTIKKGLLISSVLAVLAVVVLLVFTVNVKTLEALSAINYKFLAFSVVLMCLSLCFDVLRILVLTKAISHIRLPFLYGVKIVLSFNFLSNITPSSAGGEPLLIYQISQKGSPLGEASAIAFLRIIITMLFFAIGGPIIICFHRELLADAGLKAAFDYVAVFLAATVVFFAYIFYASQSSKKFLNSVFGYFEKFPFSKIKFSRLKERIFKTVDDFKYGIRVFFSRRKWYLFLFVAYTALMIATQFLVAQTILKGLGYEAKTLNVFMIQTLLSLMLYFAPTPGGSGIAEGAGYALFAQFVPIHIVGAFLIIWKFLTTYVWTIVGGLVIAKSIGMKNLINITGTHKAEKSNKLLPQ